MADLLPTLADLAGIPVVGSKPLDGKSLKPTKDFKPMLLGTIRLDKGRGPLTIRAVEIPGRQAIEISALVLTRR